ncbi:MAG: class I SAM-dependent RNA methyltransferase, partial [Methylobacteriaceae bacterium]|nr:class I SAM-dependent RNA methyltransferase [Methylobacteriaceae bacterium]
MAERVTIARLGSRGDGIAETATGPLSVPKTLPGEEALVDRDEARGRLVELLRPSPERVEPFCPYFSRCGGCAAQHMPAALYRAWKLGRLTDALRRAGLAPAIDPLVDAHGAGRRRVTFHLRPVDGRLRAGFMEPRSHRLVPIDRCPITVPALARAAAAAEGVGSILAATAKPIDVAATATAGGLDLDLRGSGPIADALRLRLIAEAEALDLARLSLHGDALVTRRPPAVRMGPAEVVLRPGGFLQATEAGEAALAAAVLDGVGGA